MHEEAELLIAVLDQSRQHALGVVEGLSEEELRRPVLASGWTCLTLLNHLAVDIERFWFRALVAGEGLAWDSLGNGTVSGWNTEDDAATVLSRYRAEIALSNTILAVADLTAPPAFWPDDLFGDFRLASNRAVALHVIAETACHAGHLDAAREIIDGHQWMVL